MFNMRVYQVWLCVFSLSIAACKSYHRNKAHADISGSSISKGEALSVVYCQSCHQLPDPALLDTRSWEKGVLPGMGPRLGIFNHGFDRYPTSEGDPNIGRGFYPSQPMLSQEDWQHILDYYVATSPDTLPAQSRQRPIKMGLPLFKAEMPGGSGTPPGAGGGGQVPGAGVGDRAGAGWGGAMQWAGRKGVMTCLTKVDTSEGIHSLLIFDAGNKNLYRFSAALQQIDSMHTSGAIVDVDCGPAALLACNIGVLNPNNGKYGKGQLIHKGSDGKLQLDTLPVFDQLARPVQFAAADFNRDGRTDYLVCEFGNLTGALSWMENKGNGRYERHVIRAVPGAIKAYVNDYNHDGLPDIWALFAQGDEGIILFTNLGNGRFSEERVLTFPPEYGSSYFELADLNKDGYQDIVYTCGDNADYSPVLKPYHGIYLYMNDGHNHFSQQYFFPINGCYKAVARDFDGDGDLDIAAISFFADYDHQPEEGFVYLENLGGLDFQPYSIPEAKLGKWLTMDVADLDGDGRLDIVLGNFSYFSRVTRAGVDFKKGPPFIVLRNQGK